MGWHESLVSSGLTNSSMNSNWYIETRTKHVSYALCCGISYTNTNIDNCHTCNKYLKWNCRIGSIAVQNMNEYDEKCRKVRVANETKKCKSM